MNTDEFFLALSSNDGIKLFPNNSASDFTIQLPKIITLDDQWTVALVEVIHEGLDQDLRVVSSLVEERVVGGELIPLLALICDLPSKPDATQLSTPTYCKLSSTELSRINIRTNLKGPEHITLVLHFVRSMASEITLPIVLDSLKDNNVHLNSPSSFTNELPYEMYLEKDMYEIALIDISFIPRPTAVRETKVTLRLLGEVQEEDNSVNPFFTFEYKVNITKQDFANILNAEIIRWSELIKDQLTQVPSYEVKGEYILEKSPGKWMSPKSGRQYTAELVIDRETFAWFRSASSRQSSVRRIYSIYCSVIEPVIVGERVDKIIRLVSVSDEASDESFSLKFTRPYFIPLAENCLKSIKVEIQDILGASVNLPAGRTVVTLHIRERFIR